jgi:serine/threonine-protein kinase
VGSRLSEAERSTIRAFVDQRRDIGKDATVRATIGDLATEKTLASPITGLSIALSDLPAMSVGGGASTPDDDDARADLEIVDVLGEGGMGVVYRARQRSLRRDVALKVVRSDEHRPGQLATLLHEARLMGSLEHPGIIAVHALGLDRHARPILVMKRVEGTSWQELLSDPDHTMWSALGEGASERLLVNIEILMQVASTIAFAHSRGVLHRDIKPANVLIGSFGEVYVADWGVAIEKAHLADSGQLGPVGTPSFMAPELVAGHAEAMDERTDVYLLGATLHVLLTGRPRHDGDDVLDVLFAARESMPPELPSTVPAALSELVRRSTAARREDRPASALAFRAELAEYLRHRGSLELSRQGEQSLSEARAALRSASPDAATKARSLLAEARFALAAARREWPDNATAQAAMERLLETTFDIAMGERAVGAARAALAEMRSPRRDLSTRLDALIDDLGREEADRREAQRLVRDLDPTVARRNRTLFLVFLALAGVGVTVGMRTFRRDGSMPVPRTIALPVVLAAALLPVAWWLRADLAKSAVNRRFLAIVYALFGASTVLRALAYLYRTPIEPLMTYELVVIGAAAAMLGITFHRAFGLIAVGAIACAFGAYAAPDWLEAFYVLPFLAIVALSAFAERSPLSSARDPVGAREKLAPPTSDREPGVRE